VIFEPLDEEAVHETLALSECRTTATCPGALGTPTGVTALEGLDALLLPAAFAAVTVKV
jgi:hypothetical protein